MMTDLPGGGPRRDDDLTHLGDAALARERAEADQYLRQERLLIDTAVAGLEKQQIAPVTRDLLRRLKDRIRSQRERTDFLRARTREATDVEIGDEHTDERDRSDSMNEQLRLASRTVQTQLDSLDRLERVVGGRPQALRGLWNVLAEVDLIASAIHQLRIASLGLEREAKLLAYADQIDAAAERILESAGEILDPLVVEAPSV